ncbi:Bgt-20673 [Blumeria graminis f. sp. tritici]|uniref:Bgt-20673 n=2 Tax=Blumeria graminis f. sp. tritici TaxID=62690 RepID=A0A9X9MK66_BLUGR|nr:Bgt-20673 [Blumeria graminis f. sp. tritici]
MMSSLRSVAGNRLSPAQVTHAKTVPTTRYLDPEAICKQCRHRRMNKERSRNHPNLDLDTVGVA